MMRLWHSVLALALVLSVLPATCWGSPVHPEPGCSLLQSAIPFCPAAVSEETAPAVLPLGCPSGMPEYKGGCYATCKSPLTMAPNRPDLCMMPCTGTLTSGDGGAVAGSTTCIRCPTASPEYLRVTNHCYPKCTSGKPVGNLRCPTCPSGFNQFNATHCIKSSTSPTIYGLRPSPCQARNASVPTTQISRLVANPVAADKQCADNDTQVGDVCLACPEGLALEEAVLRNGTTLFKCRTPQFCFGESVSCGGFCVSTSFFQGVGTFLYDEQCDAAFGQLPKQCYANCGTAFSLPDALPTSPVCPAAVSQQQNPNVLGGICPASATEYLGRCYAACVAPLTQKMDRPDQCLRPCNGTLTSGEGAAVMGTTKCIRCPITSPDYALSTNRCYPMCASGTFGFGGLCCPACPTGSYHLNATHCYKANTTPRVYILRPTTCQARMPAVPIKHDSRLVDKVPVDKECEPGAYPINDQCYTCPQGLELDVRAMQPGAIPQLQCTTGLHCPEGSMPCGGFCVKKDFYDSAGFQGDDQCSIVFGQLPHECLVGCDLSNGTSLPTASPPPPVSEVPDSTGCSPANATCVCTAPSPRTGRYADQSSGCTKFYQCDGPGQYYRWDCPGGLQFSNAIQDCDYPANVQCTTEPPSPPSPPQSSGTGGSPSATGVARYLNQSLWSAMFKNVNSPFCTGADFYTYDAFIQATRVFPDFANSADDNLNRRELAAFLAQISHEVTGGPATNNMYDWGLCWKVELCVQAGNDAACASYCDPTIHTCKAGKKYYGRGPIQLSWNYNYAQAGSALGLDLLNNPDLISTNSSVAFMTALWFWMAPQAPKPSCHDVMAGRFTPTTTDIFAGRMPGYGLITNIINGMLECGQPTTPAVWDRINYYERYAPLLGTTVDANLECDAQRPYSSLDDGGSSGDSSSSGNDSEGSSGGGSGLPDPSSSGCSPANATCVCTTPAPRTGRFADQSSNCGKYYQCDGPGQYFRGDCPPGLQFSNMLQACDWPANVQCTTDPLAPPSPPPRSSTGDGNTGAGVTRYLTQSLWNTMLRNINNSACTGANFYTYDAFIAATRLYPDFANTADEDLNRRELAAFLAQISHEVTGGPAINNQYDWGLCWKVELCVQAGNDGPCAPYCDPTTYPCKAGKKYYGRGPIQLSWNYNYAQMGAALGMDLLNNPDIVGTNASVAFMTALWFWMAPQAPKPSCHAVMTGGFTPTAADISAGRVPGYGWTTNIINGGLECNQPTTPAVRDRINYFKRYTMLLETTPGDNLECNTQRTYA